jgi:PLP dependent protein
MAGAVTPPPAPPPGPRSGSAASGAVPGGEPAVPAPGRAARAGAEPGDGRTAEIAANLRAVRQRIAAACAVAGRDPAGITLIGVTKTFPATDVRRLVALGIADVGENRDQEASTKAEELTGGGVRWHFLGRLQRNKANSVARYATVVHSVDRPEIAAALARGAARAARGPLDVLVQVNLDDDPSRGGAAAADVPALAAGIAAAADLRLAGVMAVAPLGAEPAAAFARLAEIAADLRATHPGADVISAGMSSDLEAAIRHGATHVRIGTALLGGRTPPVR